MSDFENVNITCEPVSEGPQASLSERRKNYEDWIASGRLSARPSSGPGHTRTDEGPSAPNLAAKRAAAEAEAAGHLISPLQAGSVVRTDKGDEDVNPSDDIRLGFGKSLLAKTEGADAETAVFIANAAQAMLGPLLRADDTKKDEDVDSPINGKGGGKQPKTPSRPGSSPLNRRAAGDDDDGPEEKERRLTEDDEKPEPTLREVMDALKGLGKRMDALEKQDDDDGSDSGSEDNPVTGGPRGPGEGLPKQLAADAVQARVNNFKWQKKMETIGKVTCEPATQDLFSKFQARADTVYGYHGQQAPKPLHGETLNAYRRRLLMPFLPFSPAFRRADLRVLAVDPAGFNHAEDVILADAEAEARNPTTVPLGHLREQVEERNGHRYTRFHGRPKSWMATFAPRGRRVSRIDQQNEHGETIKTLWKANY